MRVDSVAHSTCLWPPRHLLRSYIRYASATYFLEYNEMPVSFRRLETALSRSLTLWLCCELPHDTYLSTAAQRFTT